MKLRQNILKLAQKIKKKFKGEKKVKKTKKFKYNFNYTAPPSLDLEFTKTDCLPYKGKIFIRFYDDRKKMIGCESLDFSFDATFLHYHIKLGKSELFDSKIRSLMRNKISHCVTQQIPNSTFYIIANFYTYKHLSNVLVKFKVAREEHEIISRITSEEPDYYYNLYLQRLAFGRHRFKNLTWVCDGDCIVFKKEDDTVVEKIKDLEIHYFNQANEKTYITKKGLSLFDKDPDVINCV